MDPRRRCLWLGILQVVCTSWLHSYFYDGNKDVHDGILKLLTNGKLANWELDPGSTENLHEWQGRLEAALDHQPAAASVSGDVEMQSMGANGELGR